MSWIATLAPCFANIGADISRGFAYLIDHREPLFRRKSLCDFENGHGSVNSRLIHAQLLVTSYALHWWPPCFYFRLSPRLHFSVSPRPVFSTADLPHLNCINRVNQH